MLQLFSDLEIHIRFVLIFVLCFIFIYEAINGFHDTANSVVPVIYTCALRSYNAVIMSGIFNFLGVVLSGVSVSYTIIHLLPSYFFINVDANHILIMISSVLFAAILWNLGTWYFGLPTSSSHTLIGTLIGIGLANSIVMQYPINQGINISQLIDIFFSLIISPIFGLILARIIILILFQFQNPNKYQEIFLTPSEQNKLYGRKQPAFWTRFILIISAAGVSFSHGANDGQKGISLVMLLLIGVAPTSFMLNMHADKNHIYRTLDAVNNFQEYYIQNYNEFKTIIPLEITSISMVTILNQLMIVDSSIQREVKNLIQDYSALNKFSCIDQLLIKNRIKKIFDDSSLNLAIVNNAILLLKNLNNYTELDVKQRFQMRQSLIYISNILDQIIIRPDVSYKNKNFLKCLRKNLLYTVEYAPTWIILAVALSLSLGTTIGWKRVSITIGEKIGKKDMTYAQGLSAQLTTAISIGTASYIGMPVSTTHVLSSSITGSMLVKGWGVQRKIIKNILITWILTLPVSIILSGGFYLLALKLLGIYITI